MRELNTTKKETHTSLEAYNLFNLHWALEKFLSYKFVTRDPKLAEIHDDFFENMATHAIHSA